MPLMEVMQRLEKGIREEIRTQRIDPTTHRDTVRSLIDHAVADYHQESLRSGRKPIASPEVLTRTLLDEISGFGPLQSLLDDPRVEEIWINDPRRVFISRQGRNELTNIVLTQSQVELLVERMLKASGRRVDLSSPFVDASLHDGSRLHVVIPDITRTWAVNIRKFIVAARTLKDLVQIGTLPASLATVLEGCVYAGLNVIVSGATQAGKTTLLGCLAAAIPATARIISAEEVFELQIGHRDWVPMQCRQPNLEGTGDIPLRRIVKEALRMRPERIIVGEVRQDESLDLLLALNSGLAGMATLHANSASEALTKLCTLPLLAGPNITSQFVVPTVAASIDIIVHAHRSPDGKRQIAEVIWVSGHSENGTINTAHMYQHNGRGSSAAKTTLAADPRFAAAGIDMTARLRALP